MTVKPEALANRLASLTHSLVDEYKRPPVEYTHGVAFKGKMVWNNPVEKARKNAL